MIIKWPINYDHRYDNKLKSLVNLFRIIFAYLGGYNQRILTNMEEDFSYINVHKTKRIYKALDSNGNKAIEPVG